MRSEKGPVLYVIDPIELLTDLGVVGRNYYGSIELPVEGENQFHDLQPGRTV